MSVFILDFFGDLPVKRPDCREPMCFSSLEATLRKVYEMFVQGKEQPGINLDLLPDPEDDRIVVWEADPSTGRVMVSWAFNGWHWPHDDMPGMAEAGDDLEIDGKIRSLYDIAMADN